MRDAGADADLLERVGQRQRRGKADVQHPATIALAPAKLGLHRGDRGGLRRQERDPERPVQRVRDDVAPGRLGPAIGEDRRGDIARRPRRQPVKLLQVRQHGGQLAQLCRVGPALDIASPLDRMRRQLAQGQEGHRLLDPRPERQLDRRRGRPVRHRHLHQPARRHRRAHACAQQAQEGQPLAFRDQVGAVEDRVGQPAEQLDHRAPGIALARVGPLGRVRRDAAHQIGDEIVEAAVVEGWRTDGH